ncbi:MAG TPA: hypothetical protein DD409_04545 [Bacteroidales bacterium]|nr:hypothetical protein [Bacteroidales bacterium]
MTVNGRLSGGRTGTDGFTAYVNPYVVVSNGSRLSKHIYAGSQRIVSKLCASGSSPSNPLIVAKAAESVVNYTAKYTALKASVAASYDSLGLPFLGTDHAGSGFWTPTAPTIEDDQYFYHPDHLGSSSLITTLGGVLAQHLEYLPFGEVFVDERATPTTRSTPYKFNAKELDEETGLYYYGARYLDPRLSLWLSVDPLAEKYPGVGSYVYCVNNPVRYVDPTGEDWYEAADGTKQFDQNVKSQKDLKSGKYLGESYLERGATYRKDGSIMYTSEKDAYKRIWDNGIRNKSEEMGALLSDGGVLVLPSYNRSEDSYDLTDYGYSVNKGNIVDAAGVEYQTLATVHNHPSGNGPSFYTGDGYGDLSFASFKTPYKPVYVIQMNDSKTISLIVASPNTKMKASDFNYRVHTLPKVTADNLFNGSFSLKKYTRQNNFYNLLKR